MKRLFIVFVALNFINPNMLVNSANSTNAIKNEFKDFKKAPSFFKNLSKYKKVDYRKYIISHTKLGQVSSEYFITPESNKTIDCSLGGAGFGPRLITCSGNIPGEINTASFNIKTPKFLEVTSPYPAKMEITAPFYIIPIPRINHGKEVQVLSKNSLIFLPKDHSVDGAPDADLLNDGVVCIVPDLDSFGCVNTSNNGFYITKDGTFLF